MQTTETCPMFEAGCVNSTDPHINKAPSLPSPTTGAPPSPLVAGMLLHLTTALADVLTVTAVMGAVPPATRYLTITQDAEEQIEVVLGPAMVKLHTAGATADDASTPIITNDTQQCWQLSVVASPASALVL